MNVQKLLFIIPALPDYVPYVYNYFKIAEDVGKEYDVVCWNRRGMEAVLPANYIVYNHPTKDSYPTLKKLREIYIFSRFVRKSIRGRKYDAVFTYTIADTLFFGFWLPRCYKGRYVFDIRDYSPLISNRFTGWIIKRLLGASAMNVISSDGFRKWLPKGFDYTVCHNTDLEKVRESIHNYELRQQDGTIRLLTIGNLRNADANQSVIDALANREGIELQFAGGGVSDKLQLHCKENNIKNVHFSGRYRKEDEDSLVQQCDMMNIMLPHDAVSDHLMSNRFYLSVRFRKPMVVNDNCFQAEVVRHYRLGLVASADSSLCEKIITYYYHLDWEQYNENCVKYLHDVCDELDIFKKRVENLICK